MYEFPKFYFVKKLHVSGIYFAHHQEFSTVHLALVYFLQVLMTASKQNQDGTALQFHQNLHETYQVPNVWYKTPDGGQRKCPKHVAF